MPELTLVRAHTSPAHGAHEAGDGASQVEIAVAGMTCASCFSHIEGALNSAPGVNSDSVNLLGNTKLMTDRGVPDTIVLKRGKPARLNFRREETASCSETVLLPDFGKSARLPEGETVASEFMPDRPGEFEFAGQMKMLRGKLVVE